MDDPDKDPIEEPGPPAEPIICTDIFIQRRPEENPPLKKAAKPKYHTLQQQVEDENGMGYGAWTEEEDDKWCLEMLWRNGGVERPPNMYNWAEEMINRRQWKLKGVYRHICDGSSDAGQCACEGEEGINWENEPT